MAFWLVFVSRTRSQLLLGKRLALMSASLSVSPLPAHRWASRSAQESVFLLASLSESQLAFWLVCASQLAFRLAPSSWSRWRCLSALRWPCEPAG